MRGLEDNVNKHNCQFQRKRYMLTSRTKVTAKRVSENEKECINRHN